MISMIPRTANIKTETSSIWTAPNAESNLLLSAWLCHTLYSVLHLVVGRSWSNLAIDREQNGPVLLVTRDAISATFDVRFPSSLNFHLRCSAALVLSPAELA